MKGSRLLPLWGALLIVALQLSCETSLELNDSTFVCVDDYDCAAGWVCRTSSVDPSLSICVTAESAPADTTPDASVDLEVVEDGSPELPDGQDMVELPPLEGCGDGAINGAEACDDGNTVNDDGCTAQCMITDGWSCQGAPSQCATRCGDSIRAGDEACDGSDFGDASCGSVGFSGGDLSCDGECAMITTACYTCGDGVCDTEKGEDHSACRDDCGFAQLSVGADFSCAVRGDGTVWCWGDNEKGQLGHGGGEPYVGRLTQVSGLTRALQVDAGGHHACALVLDEGQPEGGDTSVYCWGENSRMHSGNADLTHQLLPNLIGGLDGTVVQVDVGWSTSCARKRDKTVWCWGNHMWSSGGHWTLGACDFPDQTSAVAIQADETDVEIVSADAGNVCVLETDGSVWCWGANDGAERGDGTIDLVCPATQPQVPGPMADMITGDHYSMAIDASGAAYAWGRNETGQLANDTATDPQLTPVLVQGVPPLENAGLGWFHTCGTTTAHDAYCWGANDYGQLGLGTVDADVHVPTSVPGLDGAVIEAEAGYFHSCALLDTGAIRCWGRNHVGQLGVGDGSDLSDPTEVSY